MENAGQPILFYFLFKKFLFYFFLTHPVLDGTQIYFCCTIVTSNLK